MARRPRRVLPSYGWWHLTCRGVDGMRIYRDRADGLLFLAMLERTIRTDDWTCEALCLMGNR